MRMDLRALRAERGAALVVSCSEPMASGIVEMPFVGPVEGTLSLTNLGPSLRVEGRLVTRVDLVCDRCAAPFRAVVEAPVYEDLAWDGEEFLAAAQGTTVLDVDALAREMLLLALPTPARCHPDCPGLCGKCGADLNAGRCACE
ncbi:MAG: DUF177 domain-containing protein [Armatimonadetes bacterium]|nr:DUF177 domain-containing protein [Armatimonadota bacterium]